MAHRQGSRKRHQGQSERVGRWYYPESAEEALERSRSSINEAWERTEQLREKYRKERAAG